MQDDVMVLLVQFMRKFPNDEAARLHLSGRESNKHENKEQNPRHGAVGKTLVLSLRSRSGKGVARDTKQETVHAVLNEVLEDDVILVTNGHRTYKESIESVWAVLKRVYHGIYHDFFMKHVQLYVNEVAFRFNDTNVKVHANIRMNRLWECCIGKRIVYKVTNC